MVKCQYALQAFKLNKGVNIYMKKKKKALNLWWRFCES